MLLGIDVGTTGAKALLLDASSGTCHIAHRSYGLYFPQPDHVEQKPDEVWEATKAAVSEVLAMAGGRAEVASVSVSSQGGTLIPLGRKFEPLASAIVWLDHRGRVLGDALTRRFGKDFFYLKTGWPLTGCLPLIQIRWLREERPELFKRISRFAFVGDYITYRLSGEWVADPSSASITMLYNLEKGTWDEELLQVAGIGEDQLPTIVDSGTCVGVIEPSLRERLGLRGKDIMVSSGGHDQYCASLGAGAFEDGNLLLSGGTAWVMLLTLGKPIFDTKAYLSPGRHVIRGKWGLMSSIPAGGAGVDWLRELLAGKAQSGEEGRPSYAAIEHNGYRLRPGSDGLLFFPHFLGATAPTWETNARGTVVGLGLHHRPAHMFRALLEGIGFEVLWNVQTFRAQGAAVNSATMIGGAARSLIWPQIISNILDMPITIPRTQEAACVGAAVLGGLGAGAIGHYREGLHALLSGSSVVNPNPEDSQHYGEIFARYRKTFSRLRDAWSKSACPRPSQKALR